ncbi:MAG: Asp23/Gls24 family envelope stress response protein [Clostridia bacterium]|nr:Asp23/Gls24 family envelope stress response protein [Clostridia bacterium]
MEENQNQNENNQEIVKVEKDNTTIETVNTVKISNEAVATYVGIAIVEVSGVYGMSGTLAGITEAISGKKSYTRGVKVEVTDKTAKIDVSIVVEYGARIPDVAFEIQTKVKKAVETMTGLKVSEVNVNVNGVHAIAEKEENKTEEES